MASTTATAIPTYFDLSWAVISTIGLFNVIISLMVAGIANGFSRVLLVPLVVSAACALANGLCYVAYIAEYPAVNKAVAAIFASLGWTIQEGGLPFYGYMILIPILRGCERRIFLAFFWGLTLITVALRGVATSVEMLFTFQNTFSFDRYQMINRRLCTTCFVTIALAECTTAVFLLREFRASLRSSSMSPLSGGMLFHYLMRSTEIRVSTLALIGIMRVVTFSYHAIGSGSAEGVASQLDRFAVTLQALFPIVMLFDIFASRLVFARESSTRSNGYGRALMVHQCTTMETDGVASEDREPCRMISLEGDSWKTTEHPRRQIAVTLARPEKTWPSGQDDPFRRSTFGRNRL